MGISWGYNGLQWEYIGILYSYIYIYINNSNGIILGYIYIYTYFWMNLLNNSSGTLIDINRTFFEIMGYKWGRSG